MTSVDLRDCECSPATRYTNLSSIMLMFRCASCGGIDHFTITDIDGAITALTKLRATAFHGRATPDGVQRADRAQPTDPRP